MERGGNVNRFLVDPSPTTLGTPDTEREVLLCVDERARVWVVLHSASRGIGNRLVQMHTSCGSPARAPFGPTFVTVLHSLHQVLNYKGT